MNERDPERTEEALKLAEQWVERKLGFYRHLAVYIVVNIGILAFNMATSPYFLWFLVPLCGWGIGVVVHAVSVFGFSGQRVERWRQREIEKELDRLTRKD